MNTVTIKRIRSGRFAVALVCLLGMSICAFADPVNSGSTDLPEVKCRLQEVEGIRVFYREAGAPGAPVLLLLHGFPASSFYFRNLIPLMARKHHVIAPDCPGFGHSDTPEVDKFVYTFDHLGEVMEKFLAARGITNCVIYMQDYGGPLAM